MNKKITKIYHMVMLFALLVCIFAMVIIDKNVSSDTHSHEVVILNDSFTEEINDNAIVYTGILSEDTISDKFIEFYTAHSLAKVYVADKEIYSLQTMDKSLVKTTGYTWNFVPLKDEYIGKEIRIELTAIYKGGMTDTIIYYGHQNDIMHSAFAKEGFSVVIAIGVFLVGAIMLVYASITRKKAKDDHSIMHLGVFSILLALWCLFDTSFLALFSTKNVGMVFATHLCLMLMTTPFSMFLKSTFIDKDNPLWFFYNYFNLSVCGIRIVLQLLGLLDFKETLILTHLSIALFVVVVGYLTWQEIAHNKLTNDMTLNFFTCGIILLATVADLIHYGIVHDNGAYGVLGFLIYIIIMGLKGLERTQKNLARSREAEIYRRLAFTDELTGLYNRMAFQRRLEHKTSLDKRGMRNEATTILMFDLNDLKKCNDSYGHEYGDAYIKMVAEKIHSVFSQEGKCYRIGGDEFCAILELDEENKIQNMIESFQKKINELNNKKFVVPVGVAVGYAIYNHRTDESLEDTKNRADKKMYEYKNNMKNNMKNNL